MIDEWEAAVKKTIEKRKIVKRQQVLWTYYCQERVIGSRGVGVCVCLCVCMPVPDDVCVRVCVCVCIGVRLRRRFIELM